ncbi:sodium:proton antiporter [Tetragenococcus halophilus subsp. flandriensis]|uniref:Na+/H+ antiporter NhaC family protein n=1 Tax=Tetragenococcus halophilus TaxID=51669 RepID=UPI0023E90B52|nr:Na+/H+ antiporter NhaC family protein [Tetragenococcus halophilus]GMA08785.1 sodium:proton antiporter [Tetragenococcus halophilus subsp. flandriensis]
MPDNKKNVEFYGGWVTTFVPVLVFLGFCILYFVVFKAFDMHALAMGALIGLMIGALLTKRDGDNSYWSAVYEGVKEAVPVAILLLIIGMFSQMIKVSQLSSGFIWLAETLSINGGLFTAVTFLFTAIIAAATGSSIGTLFTAFPIFFPAGVLLGSHPAALAGALISGAIFGDNVAPISDTTIISAGTQEYTTKHGFAEIAGAVVNRMPYALISGVIAFSLFWIFGGSNTREVVTSEIFQGNASTLVMLVPVVIMLFMAIKTRNIYFAITIGIILGIIVGLISNVMAPSDILAVEDGIPTGFLTDGVSEIMGTVVLVLSVYGIMGVLEKAEALNKITDKIYTSAMGRTDKGTELAMMIGITLTTIIFGGVTSASMTTFGKVQNELGKRANLHPYRRALLLDGFANALGVMIPFLSVFIFIGSQLTQGYEFVRAVPATTISIYMFYSAVLFLILLISVVTGWGRSYEGNNGEKRKIPHRKV